MPSRADAPCGVEYGARVPLPAVEPPVCWGPMTPARFHAIERRGIYLRIIDGGTGADVTRRCLFCDDTPGRAIAVLFRLDARGRPIFDRATGGPVVDRVRWFHVAEGAPPC